MATTNLPINPPLPSIYSLPTTAPSMSSPPSTVFAILHDSPSFKGVNPLPERFTLHDLKAPKLQQNLFTSLSDEDFFVLACTFERETKMKFGVVWVDCDCDTGDALTWEEAEKIHPDLQMGTDEPGDDCGAQWYCVTEENGFPSYGWYGEHHLAISERYLRDTPEPLRSKIIIEFLLPHLSVVIS